MTAHQFKSRCKSGPKEFELFDDGSFGESNTMKFTQLLYTTLCQLIDMIVVLSQHALGEHNRRLIGCTEPSKIANNSELVKLLWPYFTSFSLGRSSGANRLMGKRVLIGDLLWLKIGKTAVNQPNCEDQDLQNAPNSSSIRLMRVVVEASLIVFLYRRKQIVTDGKRHCGLYPHQADSSPWLFEPHRR